MTEGTNFQIFLYVKKKKYTIFLFDTNKLKNLYKDEVILNNYTDVNFKELLNFLDDNIFKIEKLLGKFIKDIFIIIEDDLELETNISLKKKNNNNKTNKKNFSQALIELKDLFKENNQDQNIIHMLIDNYFINGKNYNFFVENLESDFLNLDVKFITLPYKFSNKFDKIFEKYQIKIKQFISAKYLNFIFKENNAEISLMAYNIIEGYNPNEIKIVPKTPVNKGFFEKFFRLFN